MSAVCLSNTEEYIVNRVIDLEHRVEDLERWLIRHTESQKDMLLKLNKAKEGLCQTT